MESLQVDTPRAVGSWSTDAVATMIDDRAGLGVVVADSRPGMVMAHRLSVIVPVLNEAALIHEHVARLARTPGIHEVILADGGSTDDTVAQARAVPGVRVVDAPRGRGPQMNAGAQVASGDVFWFVHADVELPADAPTLVDHALRDHAVVGGAFRVRTESAGASGWPTRLLWLADQRSKYVADLPYGDQAVFVRRGVFEQLGGFAPLPLFEDVEFSHRLRRAGRVHTLPAVVRVSGRRFVARPIASVVLMNVLPILYRLGVPPAALARMYGDVR
jgi:rSAM/selenodomain-associated transferase 2